MNILYYDLRQIKLPDPLESDDEDKEKEKDKDKDEKEKVEDHFISIGKDSRYRKGHMLDIYVSIVSDMTHKIIIHVNDQ